MKIVQMMIEFDNGQLKVRVQVEDVNFNLFELMKHPKDKGSFFQINGTEESIKKNLKNSCITPTSLEQTLTCKIFKKG